jgi:hypothetical protein
VKLVATAIAVCLVAAPAAAAQAPPAAAPDERAAAREFSFAAYRLRVALKAQQADLEGRLQASIDALLSPRCEDALVALILLPAARQEPVAVGAGALALSPAIAAMRPAFQRFQAELERVPTADPALRSGRAEWRTIVASLAAFPAQVDVCATLERWRRARFALSATPFGLDEVPGAFDQEAESSPKLRRAARRMRQLGVAPGTARRFTGDTLLDGIFEDVEFPD